MPCTPVGNPNLKPERSYGWEAGAEQSFLDGRGRVDVTYFHAVLRDKIVSVFAPTYTVVNAAEIETAATLFDRSTAGEAMAMDSLLEHYLPHLHAFVSVQLSDRLRDREDSLDVVQSVCKDLEIGRAHV